MRAGSFVRLSHRTSPKGLHPKDITQKGQLMTAISLSPRRQRLSNFSNAYAVACQLRETTGADQFVVRTGNPIQPFRVSRHLPHNTETILALVA